LPALAGHETCFRGHPILFRSQFNWSLADVKQTRGEPWTNFEHLTNIFAEFNGVALFRWQL